MSAPEPTDEMVAAVRERIGGGEVAAYSAAEAVLAILERAKREPVPSVTDEMRRAYAEAWYTGVGFNEDDVAAMTEREVRNPMSWRDAGLAAVLALAQRDYAAGYAQAKADAAVMYGVDGAAHEPHRGDEVEAWIKRTRDGYQRQHPTTDQQSKAWYALDNLLNDYRAHADTGIPLGDEIQGWG